MNQQQQKLVDNVLSSVRQAINAGIEESVLVGFITDPTSWSCAKWDYAKAEINKLEIVDSRYHKLLPEETKQAKMAELSKLGPRPTDQA